MNYVAPELLMKLERCIASEAAATSIAELPGTSWRSHQDFLEAYRAHRVLVVRGENYWQAVVALSDRRTRLLYHTLNHAPAAAAFMCVLFAALLRDASLLITAIPFLGLYVFAGGRLTFFAQTLPMLIICGICFLKGKDWHSISLEVISTLAFIGLILLSFERAWPNLLIEEAILSSESVLLWLIDMKMIDVYPRAGITPETALNKPI